MTDGVAERPSEPVAPATSHAQKVEITQEEHELLQQFKKQSRKSENRETSPKRQKVDADLQTFVDSLAENDIEWMELDPQLRQRLQTDAGARKESQRLSTCALSA